MPSTFKPYVQLVDVTATAALVACGGFALEQDASRGVLGAHASGIARSPGQGPDRRSLPPFAM